jgi:thiamine biosynthesis lipoprotein
MKATNASAQVRNMETSAPLPPGLLRDDAENSIQAHRFAYRAMATVFEIVCVHEERGYAEQAARAAFDMIDRIETELTCHRSSSDISRINRLRSGEATLVCSWAMDCLLLARHFYSETGGAFDVSLGSGFDAVEMMPADSCVRIHREKVRLDLGGIGKGYAIDRAADLLQEWEISRALIHGGFSSVLVLEPPPDHEGWPLTISLPGAAPVLERIVARRQAWSASGIRKKDHIVDPRTGLPVRDRSAVWVSGSLESLSAAYRGEKSTAPSGTFDTGDSPSAVAEALSTAFMIMSREEIADWCLRHPGVEARILISDPPDASGSPVLLRFAH